MAKLLWALVAVSALACAPSKSDAGDVASTTRASAGAPPTAAAPGVLREEATVQVGAVPERWALVWKRTPLPVCGPDEPELAMTCSCTGFAYGESGELDLVRRRPGRADARLELTPFFHAAGTDGPGDIDSLAVLRRWPVRQSDFEDAGTDNGLPAAIRARPAVRAMALGDYDHDGRATEFVLQVGTLPCGRREGILVGVSAADSSLHAFTSVAHPERPLVLEAGLWESLRRSGGGVANGVTSVEWPCGDHGSETQTEVRLWAGPSGVGGSRSTYACSAGNTRGRLISSQPI